MLHKLHRYSALLIGLFVVAHLANHAAAIGGVEMHIAIMEKLRVIYRQPLLEGLLLACVLFQACSGIIFIRRRWGQRHCFFDIAQALSGAYMAFFLFIHVSAVLMGRSVLGLDTNFWYAAAGLNIFPYTLFFMPYYFIAVLAFVTHVSCALHWAARNQFSQTARSRTAAVMISLGGLFSALLVSTFSGAFFGVEIPAEYAASFP